MNFFVDINTYQATTTSPLRKNWWESFMELKFKVEDSHGERIRMHDAIKNRDRDLALLIPMIKEIDNIKDASKIIYENGWAPACFEPDMYSRVRTRGDLIYSHDDHQLEILKPNPEIQKNAHYSFFSDDEVKELKKSLENEDSEAVERIIQEYKSELFLHSRDYSYFLEIRNNSWISDKAKLNIDFLLKSCNRWLDLNIIRHENHDEFFVLKTEWLLSGGVISNHCGKREMFSYINTNIGLNLEKYLYKILPNHLTAEEYRFLLLVALVRDFSNTHPAWIASRYLKGLSNEDAEEVKSILAFYAMKNPGVLDTLNSHEKRYLRYKNIAQHG